jgi:hypothetical protein
LRLVPDESGQQPLVQCLRAVIAAKDEQISVLQSQVEAVLAREHRLELRVAELERRLSMDGSDSGTPPSSKEGIGAKAARKAWEKKDRQESERERSKDRKRGGQPGHQGKGLKRARDPDDAQTAERRLSTSRSSGRSPRACFPGWPAGTPARSATRPRRRASTPDQSLTGPC